MKLFSPDCLGKADFIICSAALLENPSVFAIEFAKWNHFEGLFFWPAPLLLLPFPVCFQGSLLAWADHTNLSSSLKEWCGPGGWALSTHPYPPPPSPPRLHNWILQQLRLRLSELQYNNPGEKCWAGRQWAWVHPSSVTEGPYSLCECLQSRPAFVLESNKIMEAQGLRKLTMPWSVRLKLFHNLQPFLETLSFRLPEVYPVGS